MQQILKQLVTDAPDLEGAAVVSPDGRVAASVLPAGTDENRVSAMAAALLALSERTAAELERGELKQVYVKGTGGYTVLMQVEGGYVLQAFTGPKAKLGMVLLDMASTAQKLAGTSVGAWETNEVRIDDDTLEILRVAADKEPAAS